MRAAILVVSDTRSAGARTDETTSLLRERLGAAGIEVADARLVPDERGAIETALRRAADVLRVDLVLASGGTGLAPRDVTPEATRAVIEREAPGIAELLRSATAAEQPLAWLSRGVAGVRGQTLIVDLPGSPRGVAEYMDVLEPLLPHALSVLGGGGHR